MSRLAVCSTAISLDFLCWLFFLFACLYLPFLLQRRPRLPHDAHPEQVDGLFSVLDKDHPKGEHSSHYQVHILQFKFRSVALLPHSSLFVKLRFRF